MHNFFPFDVFDTKRQLSQFLTTVEEQLKVANKTVEEQKIELRELRGELRDTQDELEGKCDEVSQLQGKVVNIRSHALKLEDELRSMSGGEASNVHRTAELQKELRKQKAAAGMRNSVLIMPVQPMHAFCSHVMPIGSCGKRNIGVCLCRGSREAAQADAGRPGRCVRT